MSKTLEKEFEEVCFKEKTTERIIKKVLNKSHHNYIHKLKRNKNTSVVPYNEIRDIFTEIDSEISEDMIAGELRKTKEYKKAKKGEVEKSGLFMGILAMIFVLAIPTFVGLDLGMQENNKRRFNEIYSNALIKYADTNKDGFVSDSERDEFGYRLIAQNKGFKGNSQVGQYDSKFYPGWPEKPIGEQVPIEDLTKWLEEYKGE